MKMYVGVEVFLTSVLDLEQLSASGPDCLTLCEAAFDIVTWYVWL
jgi:hypothetical protein